MLKTFTVTLRILFRTLAVNWPLVLPCTTYFIAVHAGVRSRFVRTCTGWCGECISKITAHWIPSLRARLQARKRAPASRYASPEEEAQYWKASTEAHKRLNASNANTTPVGVPLVRYYVPKLLPRYRDRFKRSQEFDVQDYRISAKVFCKWHRMVFRGPVSILVCSIDGGLDTSTM